MKELGDVGYALLVALAPLLLAALTWASTQAAKLINAKVKNETLRGILGRLEDAVFSAVREVAQTYVDAIKAGRADGALTDAEKASAKAQALAAAKTHLGAKGVGELLKVLGIDAGGLDKLLGGKIEAAVGALKASAPAPQVLVSHTVSPATATAKDAAPSPFVQKTPSPSSEQASAPPAASTPAAAA